MCVDAFRVSDRHLNMIKSQSPLFMGKVAMGCARMTRTDKDQGFVAPGAQALGARAAAVSRIGNTERSR